MNRLFKWMFGLLALATVLAVPAALAQSDAGKGTVKVMTYNLNEGSDFVEVLSAQTLPEFLQAVQTTLNEVDASNPPLRMQAIAHQIAIAQPDLVGMQEVSTWLVGDPSAPTVRYDMLQELMAALTAQGQNYKVVVVVPEFLLAGPLPPDASNWLFVQDTDVMLARGDKADLQISNVQSANFHTLLSLPTAAGPVTITRGWGSPDVSLHGQPFRFIVTHLENYIAQAPGTLLIQEAQAKELSDGPAYEMNMPVLIAGDFNADALGNDASIATHQEMLSFGFTDAWQARYPNIPAPTWPLLNSSPTSSTAFQRIDYIWTLGNVRPLNLSLVGAAPQDKVSGLWPSDHAGVRANLQLAPQCVSPQ
jgi:endonuclease/exonuclease/phosphatase family metal-dependent hydrolase